MKKSIIQILELPVLLTMALGLLACGTKVVSSTESPFSKERGGFSVKEEPLEITVWTYFSGIQQEAFQRTINRFNEGRGKDIGVEVNDILIACTASL